MGVAPDAFVTALADRYEIERPIGRGGMATVYLARDLKHGRPIAIKMMRPDLAASLGSERFLKEIEIAARLTHAHIVPLYDSGEAGSFLYYVMPYVEGGSLRTLLCRDPRPELTLSLSIAEEVADALDYAHRMGVLHRDIKPENILLSQGHAFVTDFGVAKAVSTAGGATITRTGFGLGTPGYMSPEQAAGVRDIDARTDVYGLACVVYEMLVGDTPGLWPTEAATRVGRFVDAAPEHRARLDQLPGRVERVLCKALAMRPGDRYQTPVEFVDELVAATDKRRDRFSDMRVKEIIDRAVELQSGRTTEEEGLSTRVLEEVAVEIGLPPERIREALTELGYALAAPRRAGYGDTEIEKVFGRAIELEERSSIEQGLLSIGGVEQIAAQVGVQPEIVRQAVDQLSPLEPGEPARRGPQQSLFGSPTTLTIERLAAGRPRPALYQAMVETIQRTIGTPGRAVIQGDSLTWSTGGLGNVVRYLHVTVTPRGGQTSILVEEQVEVYGRRLLGGLSGGGAGALLGFAFSLGFGLAESPISVLVASAFAIAGAALTGRSLLAAATTQRKAQLTGLAERLAALVESDAGR